jgi:fucose permease
MTDLQPLMVVAGSGAFVFGMVLTLLGNIKTLLVERLGMGADRLGGLVTALYAAVIPMMLLSGVLLDELGPQGVVVAGAIVTGMGIVTLGVAKNYVSAIGSAFLIGAGGACLSTSSSVLMLRAFFPGNAAASQNLGNVFFGLGALLTPWLTQALFKRLEFRRGMGLLGVVALLPALALLFTSRAAFGNSSEGSNTILILQDPVIWMASLIFLLYSPLEESLGIWARTYLVNLGVRERRAAWLFSGFWLTFLVSRLAMGLAQAQGFFPKNSSDPWLIVGLALAAGVFLGNMAGAHTPGNGALGLLLVGAFLGPIFPTLVGIVFNRYEFHKGTAYGAMFAIGASGNLVFPALMGAYARRNTVRSAMRIPMILALVLALVAFGLALFPILRQN